MNDLHNHIVKQLALQAGATFYADTLCVNGKDADALMKKFAELVAADVCNIVLHYENVDEGVGVAKKHYGVK